MFYFRKENLSKNLLSICLIFFIASIFAFSMSPTAYAQKAALVVQKGHSESINSIDFIAEDKILANGSRDNTIKLRDVVTGKEIRTFGRHSCVIYSVAFNSNGKTLASGGWDNTIKLWDLATGKEFHTLTGFSSVVFSPDGKTLASGGWDNTIKLWDLATGKELHTLTGDSCSCVIYSVAFSPDGKILASGSGHIGENDIESSGDTIRLWEVTTGKEILTLRGHSHYVKSVAFSPDGKILASGSLDETIKLWDVSIGKEIFTLTGHPNEVESVAFSPDGKTLASGGWDNTIKLWHVAAGKEIHTLSRQKIRMLPGFFSRVLSIAFSHDGKILASGNANNTIKLWDISTGEEIHTLKGHSSSVFSVTFSPDGKILASGSGDGKIKLWDVSNGKELASLIAIDQNEYVTVTPENYYTASKGGLKGVAFRVGNRAYPFEQFDLKLNRPDIVLKSIGYAPQRLIKAYYRAYQKRLKKMNFTEEMLGDDFHLPEIAITSHNLPLSTKEKALTFRIRAMDSKYLLDRLNVYVNDVPIYGINGSNVRDKKVAKLEQEISLELSNGKNKIQVSVLNEKGAESLKETFEVTYNGPSTKPDLFVVAIGVSDYRDDDYDLTYAAKDANDLATLLENKKERFGKINVLRILDKDATRGNILKSGEELLMRSKVDDLVILFLAGHGLFDDKLDYYFATTDVDFLNPAAKGLPYEKIEHLVDGIPSRKKLVLIDTCNSSEVDKEEAAQIDSYEVGEGTVRARSFPALKAAMKKRYRVGLQNSFELLRELFVDLRRGSGAMVISAASGMEFSFESKIWQNGVFTYAVLEGLKTNNADLDKNGEILVSELRDYVIEKVQKLTYDRQTPTMRRENLEFDFKVF